MAPSAAAASAANDKAVMNLKLAARQLERQLPPPDSLEEDETVTSEVPAFRQRARTSSIASCALCAVELENLAVGV